MADTSPFIRLNAGDNVLVARTDAPAGSSLDDGTASVEPIPAGHKVAARAIAADEPILKYATVIGFASGAIPQGAHVHRHNVELREVARDPAFCSDARPVPLLPEGARASFDGIVRADGQVATRNYIGVMATVNCSASVCQMIADRFRGPALERYPNVDGIVALGHHTGCGMDSDLGLDVLRRTLAGYARHPNFAAVLVIGLGCERNQILPLLASGGLEVSGRLRTLAIQEEGGTRATVERGVAILDEMLPIADTARRSLVSAAHLSVALQCGGSDGYSGLTANPALGHAMDLLVRNGGTAVLSETPEIYGVEHLLTRRARSPEVAEKLLERVAWWRAYTARESNQMTNNPPPGNTEGGLATIFEKSLGAAMKGGTTPLNAVCDYAERIDGPGLVFMDAPGFDPVAATGQVAGGCNLICFTTGRGSVFGCKPVPSLKLASNSAVFRRMQDDMDIDCGTILDGIDTVEEKGREIFAAILATASGRRTRSEELGIGAAEFVPWQIGAVS